MSSARVATTGPAPVATAEIREFHLNTNDIAFDAVGQKLYASVPSSFGLTGNSVMQINPNTLTVGPPIAVGSEPGRMTVSDDGRFLYVALTGAAAVRRIDLTTQSPDLHFWPGNQILQGSVIPTTEGPYAARDLITLAGQSNSVAIVRHRTHVTGAHGVALYENAEKKPNEVNPIDIQMTFRLTRGGSPSVLYGIGDAGDFMKYAVDANGITLVNVTPWFNLINGGNGNEIFFGGGFIYTKNNLKIEPEAPQIVGNFVVPSPQLVDSLFPDPQTGRLYAVTSTGSCGATCNYTATVRAYNLATLALLDTFEVPGVRGTIRRLVRWGSNGLAFHTATQLFVLRTSLVPSADPVSLPTPIQPTRVNPQPIVGTIRQISLPNTDLIYDSQRQRIYASVPGFAGANGDSIVPLNPATGTLENPRPIGIDPGKLAISRDNQFLYAGIIGEQKVRRLNLVTQTVDDEFDIKLGQSPTLAFDMAVFPDDPTSIVVGTSFSLGGGARNNLVFKNGFRFQSREGGGHTAIETSDEPSVFYGGDQQSLGGSLYAKFLFGEPGLTIDNLSVQYVANNLIGGFGADLKWDAGLLYDDIGVVGDPRRLVRMGTYDVSDSLSRPHVLPDSRAGHVYFLSGLETIGGSNWTLKAFDMHTFLPIGSMTIPGVIGPAGSLIRWGEDGIAFGTGGNQIFLIQSPTFAETVTPTPTPTPTPTVIQFGSAGFAATEGAEMLTATITRSGDTTRSATVNYATNDTAGAQTCNTVAGAASTRCDYIITLGKLHFAAGETAKTVSVPIIDDVRAEGAETFSIGLTNAIGATLGPAANATLTINDNDVANGNTNPVDAASFFVRQHYLDFLNRQPDAGGLAFWTNEITQCGTDAQCTEIKRINVSAAFFLSIEFQETGYLVYRLHKIAFGDRPGAPVPVRFTEFLKETQQIGEGVRVGIGDWQTQLELNKQKFFLEFVQRPDFMAAFPPSLTADQFVSKLDTNAGGILSPSEKANFISMLGPVPSDINKRIRIMRFIADDFDIRTGEFNKAFVLMQYFGYLRRNPDDLPDRDFGGFNFWLQKLNQFGGNFVNAEMVKAFIVSIEYRQRFGQ